MFQNIFFDIRILFANTTNLVNDGRIFITKYSIANFEIVDSEKQL